jgi:hypothetical protein
MVMIDPEQLETTWAVLEISGDAEGFKAIPLEDPKGVSSSVFLGIEKGGRRYLLVQVADDYRAERGRQGPALSLTTRDLVAKDLKGRFVALGCQNPSLNHLFTSVVMECIAKLAGSADQPDVAIDEVLESWQELLEREAARSISSEKLIGLAGELLVLTELHKFGKSALSRWQGPFGARHDFTNGVDAIEVKSTVVRTGRRVSIHGLEQLLGQPGGRLFLEYVRLELVPSNGTSISDLINGAIADGMRAAEMWDVLAQLGVTRADIEVLASFRFHVSERRTYEVDEGFPRIVPSSFLNGEKPPGILSIAYEIDLSGSQPAALDAEARESALRGIVQ